MDMGELDRIVTDELNYGEHGGYIQALFGAWIKADPGNRELLRQVIERTIEKYGMPTVVAKYGKLKAAIGMSSHFLILASQDYAEDLQTSEDDVAFEYACMKEYPGRPVIIVWHDITDEAKKYVMDKFAPFQTVVHMDWDHFKGEDGRKLLDKIGLAAHTDGQGTEAHTDVR
jgi:hypothetical protein